MQAQCYMRMSVALFGFTRKNLKNTAFEKNLVFAPCVNNIKHFIVQLMHTNYKIL